MAYSDMIISLFAFGTLIADLFIVLFIALFAYTYFSGKRMELLDNVYAMVDNNVLRLLFLVPLASLLGTLFFSEILTFTPCQLCWYQRIFMYPQFILFGMALFHDDKRIIPYGLVMSFVGICFAFFQYAMQVAGLFSGFCDVSTEATSCAEKLIFEFGYITIPMMSITAYSILIIISLIYFRSKKHFAQDIVSEVGGLEDATSEELVSEIVAVEEEQIVELVA
ncbi:MAG: disulfide bond formation protein DsbB [Patescibacteria group bacterium]|jgi:disulfide bond formation protein DsbB